MTVNVDLRKIVMVKRNTVSATPRYTHDILTPADNSGMWWLKWDMTSRYNPSTLGCVRLLWTKLAKLCLSIRYAYVFNAPQRSAGWAAITPSTINDIEGVYCLGTASETVTYTVVVPAAGRIVWEWVATTVSGRAWVEIRDSLGNLIPIEKYGISDDGAGHRYVDTYNANLYNEIYRTTLASVLAADTYTVTITASGVAGGGGSKRVYERCCFAIDDSIAGNPITTDPFVEQATPILMGSGNSEYAARFAQSGAAFADQEYASGIHGYEAGPTGMSILVDGVDIKATFDAVGTYQGTRWIAHEIQWNYKITLRTRVGSVNASDVYWQQKFMPDGYDCNLYRVALIDTDYGQEYVGMLMCPNQANGGSGIYAPGGVRLELPSSAPAIDVTYSVGANNNCSILGDGWQAGVVVVAPSNLETRYVHANQGSPKTLLTSRSDGYNKDYRATIYPISGRVVPVAAGDALGLQMQYRAKRS